MKIAHKSLASLAAATVLFTLSGAVLAGPSCDAPKDKWMKEADFKKNVEAQGYQIKTFKVSKGNCYEIYGHDKAGAKVEIYFDPVTGAALQKN